MKIKYLLSPVVVTSCMALSTITSCSNSGVYLIENNVVKEWTPCFTPIDSKTFTNVNEATEFYLNIAKNKPEIFKDDYIACDWVNGMFASYKTYYCAVSCYDVKPEEHRISIKSKFYTVNNTALYVYDQTYTFENIKIKVYDQSNQIYISADYADINDFLADDKWVVTYHRDGKTENDLDKVTNKTVIERQKTKAYEVVTQFLHKQNGSYRSYYLRFCNISS